MVDVKDVMHLLNVNMSDGNYQRPQCLDVLQILERNHVVKIINVYGSLVIHQ